MGVLRSIVAVIGGFAFMSMMVSIGSTLAAAALFPGGVEAAMGPAPPADVPGSYVAANLFVAALAATTGGWIAARIGTAAPFQHAVALAVLIAFMTILSWANAPAGPQPAWYFPAIGLIGVAGVLCGGWLRASAAAAGRA